MPKRKRTELDMEPFDLEREYIVEKILKTRMRNGKKECLIKWQSFSAKFNTWEPEENVRDIEQTEEPEEHKQSKIKPISLDENNNHDEPNSLFVGHVAAPIQIPEQKIFDLFDNQFTTDLEQHAELTTDLAGLDEVNTQQQFLHSVAMSVLGSAIHNIKSLIAPVNAQSISKSKLIYIFKTNLKFH